MDIPKSIKIHFKNNPKMLFTIRYFSKKYDITESKSRHILEGLAREGFLLRFKFSSAYSSASWGIPKGKVNVYVLNDLSLEKDPRKNLSLVV
jgi:hypothetical protein